MDVSIAALVVVQFSLTCSSEPLNNNQQMNSINRWPSTRQIFLPRTESLDTRVSVPKCALSCKATMAPMKVNQTNSHRDNSSDTVIPELKA